MPSHLAGRIRDFVQSNQEGLDSITEITTFLRQISPSLKQKVIEYEFYDVVWQQRVFRYEQKVTDAVVSLLLVNFQFPGYVPLKQNELNRNIYFLAQGWIDIEATVDGTANLWVQSIRTEKMFGELTCVMGCRSQVTYVCRNYCKLAVLTAEAYDKVRYKFPEVHKKMLLYLRSQTESPVYSYFMSMYRDITIFRKIQPRTARQLSYHCFI